MATEDQLIGAGSTRPPVAGRRGKLLIRTLDFFEVERRAPGVAVDLGCGSGPDTVALLESGWHVHAVDAEASGLQMLRESIRPEQALHIETFDIEDGHRVSGTEVTRWHAFAFAAT